MEFSDIVSSMQGVTEVVTQRVAWPIIIFFVGLAIGRIAGNLARAAARNVELDKHVKAFLSQKLPATEIVGGTISATIYTVAAIWALVEAGIIVWTLRIIVGFLAVITIIALLLWILDIASNFIKYFKVKKKYSPGQTTTIQGHQGTIRRISKTHLELEVQGELVTFPNSTLKHI